MFVCVECGSDNTHLCEQISPSVLKLSQCTSCEAVVDKYIEYDGVLVLLEMLLLKTNVYRHVVFNRRQVGKDRKVFTKYSNGTKPPAPSNTDHYLIDYYTRTIILLFLSTLTADTYTTWLNEKQTDGKLNFQVLEMKFIVRLWENLVQTVVFYLTVVVLGCLVLKIRGIQNLISSLIISSFAKLFAIPSAMWSQNTNLLVLSYILVLANNILVVRVMSKKMKGSIVVVILAFLIERYVSSKLHGSVWPWDTLSVYKLIFADINSNVTVVDIRLNKSHYWFYPPVGREQL